MAAYSNFLSIFKFLSYRHLCPLESWLQNTCYSIEVNPPRITLQGDYHPISEKRYRCAMISASIALCEMVSQTVHTHARIVSSSLDSYYHDSNRLSFLFTFSDIAVSASMSVSVKYYSDY